MQAHLAVSFLLDVSLKVAITRCLGWQKSKLKKTFYFLCGKTCRTLQWTFFFLKIQSSSVAHVRALFTGIEDFKEQGWCFSIFYLFSTNLMEGQKSTMCFWTLSDVLSVALQPPSPLVRSEDFNPLKNASFGGGLIHIYCSEYSGQLGDSVKINDSVCELWDLLTWRKIWTVTRLNLLRMLWSGFI